MMYICACNFYRLGVPEQALGGIVVEDKPSKLTWCDPSYFGVGLNFLCVLFLQSHLDSNLSTSRWLRSCALPCFWTPEEATDSQRAACHGWSCQRVADTFCPKERDQTVREQHTPSFAKGFGAAATELHPRGVGDDHDAERRHTWKSECYSCTRT